MTKEMEIIMNYELYSSFWADKFSNNRIQKILAKYYAWKVKRKYKRFVANIERAKRVWAYRDSLSK